MTGTRFHDPVLEPNKAFVEFHYDMSKGMHWVGQEWHPTDVVVCEFCCNERGLADMNQ